MPPPFEMIFHRLVLLYIHICKIIKVNSQRCTLHFKLSALNSIPKKSKILFEDPNFHWNKLILDILIRENGIKSTIIFPLFISPSAFSFPSHLRSTLSLPTVTATPGTHSQYQSGNPPGAPLQTRYNRVVIPPKGSSIIDQGLTAMFTYGLHGRVHSRVYGSKPQDSEQFKRRFFQQKTIRYVDWRFLHLQITRRERT